ncbi:MAG: U32 family peptidase [Sterolibacterium sp.]|nr:U32 family peptidase [Sterolibacterium sp.]
MVIKEAKANKLELISPARNLEFGIEAINHGADAIYIGGPRFGARAAAENSVADIEKLAAYAHRYSAQVLVALNTILRDEELEQARRIAWQAYEAGADALIVQDMGLLDLDLPPLQLHASTQTDNRTPEKVKFLQDVGFAQIVLARELSLEQIRKIASGTTATLEFFVHGALCAAYSGQCYLSYAHTGRSANRGECSQACRLPYSLKDQDGRMIAENRHLLSMKDNNQSANLRALVDAGIRAFKIEGRLKTLSYVKNVTAYYRILLDNLMAEAPEYRPASAGRCSYTFTPNLGKTFNRAATDFFVNQRQPDIASFASPKFAGEHIGHIGKLGQGWFKVHSSVPLHNGDGLSYYNSLMELRGMRINRVETQGTSFRLFPAEAVAGLAENMPVYRNRDQEFERLLEKKSAERRIGVCMTFRETNDGFALDMCDESGIATTVSLIQAKQPSRHAENALATLREHLGKLGNTCFSVEKITVELTAAWFIPATSLNALRREAVTTLEAQRSAAYQRPPKWPAVVPPPQYPESAISYLGNVFNEKACDFYASHGVSLIDAAYEANMERNAVSLMITKHCLRYSFNLCPKLVKGVHPKPMSLINGREKLTLVFDCQKCEMHVVGKLKRPWAIQHAVK